MACLSLSRAAGASTLWQAPIAPQSNTRPLLQVCITLLLVVECILRFRLPTCLHCMLHEHSRWVLVYALFQHLLTAVDSSNLPPAYLICRQRITITCASSWNHHGIRKRSFGGLLRCQSHSYSSFSERRPNEDEGGFTENDNSRGQPSERFPLHPIALVAQAVPIFSSLRARLHLCRLKLEELREESECEGFNGSLLKQGSLGMALLSTSMIARDRISPVLLTLRANPTFMSGLLAWAIAQVFFVKPHSIFTI